MMTARPGLLVVKRESGSPSSGSVTVQSLTQILKILGLNNSGLTLHSTPFLRLRRQILDPGLR